MMISLLLSTRNGNSDDFGLEGKLWTAVVAIVDDEDRAELLDGFRSNTHK